MKYGSLIILAVISLYIIIPANFFDNKIELKNNKGPVVFELTPEDSFWIEDEVSKMTLREKCSQMIMAWANGNFYNEDSKEFERLKFLITELKLGGIIFFQGDILSQALVTNKLQALSEIPLLIASDFERGLGMRLNDAIEFPTNMAVAAADDLYLTYLMGKIVGEESRAIGVHQNYAPTVDINNNPLNPIINTRSYSEDQKLVSKHAVAFIKGLNESKSLSTAKHFPGHGSTEVDSHYGLPLIEITKEEFNNHDLIPFIHSIKEGVSSVMIGHLEIPAFENEEDIPSSLSYKVVTELLKEELGFQGLIVTDALNMRAVTNNFSNEEAAVRALKAGNDILLFPPDEETAVNSIVNAVLDGAVKEERIDQSVRKILAAKLKLGLFENKLIEIEKISQIVGKKSHKRVSMEIAEKSITLLNNKNNLVPLKQDISDNLTLISLYKSSEFDNDLFSEIFKAKKPGAKYHYLNLSSASKQINAALNDAAKSDLIVISSFINIYYDSEDFSLPEEFNDLVNALIETGIPILFLNFENPYLFSTLTETDAYLCSYGSSEESQKAMIRAIFGETSISGTLPISIPNTVYKKGFSTIIKKDILSEFSEASDYYDFHKIDSLMNYAVSNEFFPGGVLLVGHKEKIIYKNSFGKQTYDKNAERTTVDAIFDLASLTKVISTTSAVMLLVDQNKINLDDKVIKYLPEFDNNGKDSISIKNLLLHNSGLIAFRKYHEMYSTKTEVISSIMNEKLEYQIGSKTVYSDLSMIVLQLIIEKVTGKSLDIFIKENLFDKIGMMNTFYRPDKKYMHKIIPTEFDNYWRNRLLRGEVHDETASLLEGVSGNAGLFSNAEDIAKFAQLLIQKGVYNNQKIFNPNTVKLFTKRYSDNSSRALGWGTNYKHESSAGALFPEESFGHTGYTGTSIWIDNSNQLFAILLTNRVHPTRDNLKIIDFREIIHTEIYNSVVEY